ncbi:MAG: hypothetical protein ILNGONEN_00823 [Syntrophorhabdaceae bacterium]|nr:hypothetical protein [Syntrophorhabdaceae bacterium]
MISHCLGFLNIMHQIGIILLDRGNAARLTADDCVALLHELMQSVDQRFGARPGNAQQTVGDCRTHATARIGEQNLITQCFQHPHRRLPDFRLVIIHKCVIKKNDARRRASLLPFSPLIFFEPTRKIFFGVKRQNAATIDSQSHLENPAHDSIFQQRIGRAGKMAGEFAEEIRP